MTKKSPWVRKAARSGKSRRSNKRSTVSQLGDMHVEVDGLGNKKMTIPDLEAFRDRLGREVTEAFCRCFVHSERLAALADWIRMLDKHEDHEAVTTGRDLWTVLWFAVGTLKEFGMELDGLKGHLRRTGLYDRIANWGILNEVSRTWVHDDKYNQLRDHVSFHTNHNVIRNGLQRLVELKTPAAFGTEQKDGRGFTRIGLNCQLLGLGLELTEEEFKPLYELAATHTVKAQGHLHQVFGQVLKARGIKYSES